MDITGFTNLSGIPYVGTLKTEAGVFDPTTGLDLSGGNYEARTKGPIRGIDIKASGNLHVRYVSGGEEVIPIVVVANHYHEIRGRLIDAIYADSDCFVNGASESGIIPLF